MFFPTFLEAPEPAPKKKKMGRPPEPLEKLVPRNFKIRTEELKNTILKFFAKPENKSMDLTIPMARILRQILLDPLSGYVSYLQIPKKAQ